MQTSHPVGNTRGAEARPGEAGPRAALKYADRRMTPSEPRVAPAEPGVEEPSQADAGKGRPLGPLGPPHMLSCLVTWCCHLVLLEFLCLLPLCSPGHWYYSMRLVLMGLVLAFVCDCLHGGSHSRCPCYWHCWLLNGAFCLQPLFKATGLARLTGSTASVSAAFSAWC
jgi:hypothetical protein